MMRAQTQWTVNFRQVRRWFPICLLLVSLVGCQSMTGKKSAQKDPFAEDKFSCGEPHSTRAR